MRRSIIPKEYRGNFNGTAQSLTPFFKSVNYSFHNLYRAPLCPVSQVGEENLRKIYRSHLEVERLRKQIQKDEEALRQLTQ